MHTVNNLKQSLQYIWVFAISLLVFGCAHTGSQKEYNARLHEYGSQDDGTAIWKPYEKQMALDPGTVAIGGSKKPIPVAPMDSVEDFRTADQYRAYGFNPRPSPHDPDVRLGAGVAIRKEVDGDWIYEDTRQEVLVGDVIASGKLPLRPLLLERDLAYELQRERRARRELGEAIDEYSKLTELSNKQHIEMSEMLIKLQAQIKIKDEIIARQSQELEQLVQKELSGGEDTN